MACLDALGFANHEAFEGNDIDKRHVPVSLKFVLFSFYSRFGWTFTLRISRSLRWSRAFMTSARLDEVCLAKIIAMRQSGGKVLDL